MAIDKKPTSQADRFADQASAKPRNAMSDFWYFLRHNKKWWLTPIVILILLFGVLVVLAGTGAAPFIYTLF
jgi:hypothetical protein